MQSDRDEVRSIAVRGRRHERGLVGAWGWASAWQNGRLETAETRLGTDYHEILKELHDHRPGTPDGGF
jgi:hypothetical protein